MAFVVPVVMWMVHFGIFAVLSEINWPVAVWTGLIVFTGLAGVGLSLLAFPFRSGAQSDPRGSDRRAKTCFPGSYHLRSLRDTEPERLGGPLPILDTSTPVPVPAPAPRERRPIIWLWALGVVIVALVTVAAIRGDAPRTADVAAGSVSPLPAAEETAIPPDSAAYAEIDPAGEDLEVCQWDYCIVHDHIGEEQIENFLYEISPAEAQAIADEVVADWDVPGLGFFDRAGRRSRRAIRPEHRLDHARRAAHRLVADT